MFGCATPIGSLLRLTHSHLWVVGKREWTLEILRAIRFRFRKAITARIRMHGLVDAVPMLLKYLKIGAIITLDVQRYSFARSAWPRLWPDRATVNTKTRSIGDQSIKPRMSFWHIWNMCFGFMGLPFGFPSDSRTRRYVTHSGVSQPSVSTVSSSIPQLLTNLFDPLQSGSDCLRSRQKPEVLVLRQ